MDSRTHRVITTIYDYLDSPPPSLKKDMQDRLNTLAEELGHGGLEYDLSPGEKASQEAAEGFLGEVTLTPEDGLTPGEKAAQEVSAQE